MKPEFHQSVPPKTQIEQTRVALAYLQQHHPDAGSWAIQLPNSRQNTTTLTIRSAGEDPRARRGGTRVTIDSATGEVLQARETRGGSFLYRFHFELYGLPRIWARWMVGVATLLMLVAIISGVITHKKISRIFYFPSRQRSAFMVGCTQCYCGICPALSHHDYLQWLIIIAFYPHALGCKPDL